jgi:integrase|tara:strand:- start:90 stop:1439 length:1350 start_codon:yes stop_codon:yes gene_type:complete
MPSLEFQVPTLNGRATICKYKGRKYLNLRVLRDGRKYTHISLNTEDLDKAHNNAVDAYVKVMSCPPRSSKETTTIKRIFEKFMEQKQLDTDRGQSKALTQKLYGQRIDQRFMPYLEYKNLSNIKDIRKDSFKDYAGFQLDKRHKGKWKNITKGLAPSTINADISTLNVIFNWMVENGHLMQDNKPIIKRIKDNKNYREEANPAFLPPDWKAFKDVLYKFDQGHENEYETWRRRWFINYVRFMYQGGFRPHEARKIRFGDVEMDKRKDGRPVAIIQIDSDTKTGKRTMVMNGNTFLNVKYHLNKGIKIRNKQIQEKNKKLLEGKKVLDFHNRLYKQQLDEVVAAHKDDLILMNPFLIGKRKIYHESYIRDWMNMVLKECNFKNRYTIYSLRSTHISYQLLKGVQVNLVAKNVGTSMEMIQQTYDGLSSRYSIDKLGFFKDTEVPKEDDDL